MSSPSGQACRNLQFPLGWYRKEMTPSISSLEKICAAFDLTLAQFFAEEEEFSVLTPDQTQLLEQWMTLSAEEKHLLLQLISHMK